MGSSSSEKVFSSQFYGQQTNLTMKSDHDILKENQSVNEDKCGKNVAIINEQY